MDEIVNKISLTPVPVRGKLHLVQGKIIAAQLHGIASASGSSQSDDENVFLEAK